MPDVAEEADAEQQNREQSTVHQIVRPPCDRCGMRHGRSLEEAMGKPIRPITLRELENEIAKSGLEYTVTHYVGGKAVCHFDRILGRLWQAAFNTWKRTGICPTQAIDERLSTLGMRRYDWDRGEWY